MKLIAYFNLMSTTPETDKAYNSSDADGPDRIDRLLACSARFERENTRLRDALEKIERHGPIMGSTGDYRQGQLDILENVSTIASFALTESSSTTGS